MSKALRKISQGTESSNESRKRDLLLIQCPACLARFALPASSLDGLEFPRFHCSRCDHVFGKEEAPLKFQSDAGEEIFEEEEEAEEAQAEEQVSDEDEEQEETESESYVDEEPVDEIDEPWPNTPAPRLEPRSRALEIPASINPHSSLGAPHESVVERNVREQGGFQMSLDFNGRTQHNDNLAFKFGSRTVSSAVPDTAAYREPLPPRQQVHQLPPEVLQNRGRGLWKGVLLLSLPFMAFLTFLLAVSLHLTSNPKATASWFLRHFPNMPAVAPAGLLITDLNFRLVGLENGERAQVISGTIENHTERSFKEITIEAVTFDSSGKKLISRKANAASTLAKTRIESFTSEMIEELQARRPARRFSLEPTDGHEFALALTGDDLPPAKYYSARIYSVR